LLFLHWKAEQKLVVAGSTIGEGFDCLFKLYWIFKMLYPAHCTNVLKFLEHFVYKMKVTPKMPTTMQELCSYLTANADS